MAEPQLTGKTWLATRYLAGDGRLTDVLPGTGLTLALDGTQMAGSSGCNYFAGHARPGDTSVDRDLIFMQITSVTRIFCDAPGVMDQEAAYLKAIDGTRRWRIDGAQLELSREDGTVVAILYEHTITDPGVRK